jgi:hypothetical protein
MSVEQEQLESQQDYLRAAKAALGMEWDEFAVAAGIKPRAFKNYRLPDHSDDHRRMPDLARRAVDQLLREHARKIRRRVA